MAVRGLVGLVTIAILAMLRGGAAGADARVNRPPTPLRRTTG